MTKSGQSSTTSASEQKSGQIRVTEEEENRPEGGETSGRTGGDLLVTLRKADAETLLELLEAHAESLDLAQARQALLNPFLDRKGIERLLLVRRLMTATEIQSLIARHLKTPEPVALRLVPRLNWRDLMNIGGETRVRPSVRRAADRSLGGRLGSLAVGEKVTIARRASAGLLPKLLSDASPTVVTAALGSARLSEGVLVPVVHRETTPPKALETISKHPRWGVRYGIRLAVARNPSTPAPAALAQLPFLKKVDLRIVAADRRISAPVVRRARVLLGDPM